LTPKTWLEWVSSRYGASWQLALLLALNNVITGYYSGTSTLYPSAISPHLIDLIGAVTAAGVLLAVNRLWHEKHGSSLPANVLTWLAVSVSVSGIQLLAAFVVSPSFDFTGLLFANVIGIPQLVVLCSLFTIVLASWVGSHNVAKLLRAQYRQINSLRRSMDARIAHLQHQLNALVDGKLGEHLSALSAALIAMTPAKSSEAAQVVLQTIQEDIRPLSWDINAAQIEELPLSEMTLSRVPLMQRLRYAPPLTGAFNAELYLAVTVVFNLPFSYFVFGWTGTMEQALSLALAYVCFKSILKKLGSRRLESWVAALASGIVAGVSGLTFVAMRIMSGSADLGSDFAIPLSMAQTAVIVSIFSTISSRRLNDIEEAQKANKRLAEKVAQLRQTAWTTRKRLANLVHGSVQGELLKIYFAISAEDSLFDAGDAQKVSQKLMDLSAKTSLENPSRGHDFRLIAESLCTSWLPKKPISLALAGDAERALESDPIAAECAVDILQEALNNAIKHGADGPISVSISMQNSTLEITVRNPVSEGESTVKSGFGSKTFDELASSWSLKIEGGYATLRAQIPSH
jgi:hypothetical protein